METIATMPLLAMILLMAKRWRRRVFHVAKGVAYAIENSQWGTRIAKALGYWWIDKDIHVTLDNVVVCGHWGLITKNKFILPKWFKAKYGVNPHIGDVLWADLAKLTTPRLSIRGKARRVRFTRLIDQMRLAHALNMGLMIEQKGDAKFRNQGTWDQIEMDRREVGLRADRLVAATLPNMAGAAKMLVAAHASGRETMVIRAQDGVPRSWIPFMTWYRGAVRWLNR